MWFRGLNECVREGTHIRRSFERVLCAILWKCCLRSPYVSSNLMPSLMVCIVCKWKKTTLRAYQSLRSATRILILNNIVYGELRQQLMGCASVILFKNSQILEKERLVF